jgi:multidrug resistance efflux pump
MTEKLPVTNAPMNRENLMIFKTNVMKLLNHKKAKLIAGVIIAGIIVMYWSTGANEETPALTPEEQPYAAVAKGRTDIDGGTIDIAASQDGVITDVFVKEGDVVKKNDLLAKQDDRVAASAFQEAMAVEKQAEANVPLTQIQLDATVRDLKRLESLLKTKVTSQQDVDMARDKTRELEQSLMVAKATLDAATARRETAKAQLEQREIRAPLDGKIVRVNARPGVGASTLNVSTLFVIAPDTQPVVRAEVEENFINDIHLNQAVEILSENEPDKTYSGKVIRIGLVFGQKKANSDDPNEHVDERVVEVITSRDNTPFLIGQRVLVRFLKNDSPPQNTHQ